MSVMYLAKRYEGWAMEQEKKEKTAGEDAKTNTPRNRAKRLDLSGRCMCLSGPGMDFLGWGVDWLGNSVTIPWQLLRRTGERAGCVLA